MEYDERETDYVKYIKNRTVLGNLHNQCISYGLNHSGDGWMDWMNAGEEFAKIQYDYEHGNNINLDVLIKSYNITLPNNIIVVQRLIKLIRITNE